MTILYLKCLTFVVLAVPPSIKDDGVRDFKAVQGKSIKLPCEVTGDPKPQISWTKNGVRITDTDPHYFINADGSLEIFSADPQDTATYSCTAINVAGLQEKRLTLYVQSKWNIPFGQATFWLMEKVWSGIFVYLSVKMCNIDEWNFPMLNCTTSFN